MQPIAASFSLSAGHPCFAGHFPGRPVVPGVLLLDRVIELAEPLLDGARVSVDGVRFLAPVKPEQEVRLVLTPSPTGRIGFTGHVGTVPVLRGELRAARS